MADYDFRYVLLSAPEARTDGSGQVSHDIEAYSQPVGDGGWSPVPGHHKDIVVPADELVIVMDMPDSTGPQKTAKNTAYKDLLATHRFSVAEPMDKTWTVAGMEAFMDANDASALEAGRADDYITVTLGLSYPVPFSL
jgi:hypothetical protein